MSTATASGPEAITPDDLQACLERFRVDFEELTREVARVIVGNREVVELTLTAMLAGGHVLLEGVPGLGKTLLVKTLADAVQLKFSRIQFTPDLMPADLIGTNTVLELPDGRRAFEFQPGPVFANIVLADEINRATPKTQSALLESMQERHVTVAGRTHHLPQPFLVLATQNPLEMDGTYPLPEAQLDRFFFKVLVRFPGAADLDAILERTTEARHVVPRAVLDGERLLEMGRIIGHVPIAKEVRAYAGAIVLATHPDQRHAPAMVRRYVRYGASPRGAQALVLAAKVRAILQGRHHAGREDIRAVAHPVLRHRIILSFEGLADAVAPDAVIDGVLQGVAEDVPPAACAADTQSVHMPATLSVASPPTR
jgi:MoxR-like ATPase